MNNWEVQIECLKGEFHLQVELSGGSRPLALIGANGSGKSTILRGVLGLENPEHAFVRVGERILHDSKSSLCVPVEERNLAYLPQGLGLFPHMNVAENILFADRSNALTLAELIDGDYSATLENLKIKPLLYRRPDELSAGECQKVALARVMIQKPQMILLDEPASALDILARREVRKVLSEQLSDLGIPSILVTHDFRDVRDLAADIAYLKEGKVEKTGSVDDFPGGEGDEFLNEFFAQP